MRARKTHLLIVPVLFALLLLPASAGAVRPGGWTTDIGPDPVATIRDLKVSKEAFSPRAGAASRIQLAFRSTIAQRARITVLDEAGRELRTIIDADIPVGGMLYAWDGRRDDGSAVADGSYEIVVEAGTSTETLSVSDIVRVDRRAPVVSTAARVRLSSLRARSFRLPVVLTEPTLVQLGMSGAAGRSGMTSAIEGGISSIIVPIGSVASLRRSFARTGRARVTLRVVATDDAGNRSARTASVELLPPIVPTTVRDVETPVAGSSRITWPVSGPITSRFGPRWGRMHTGIDIGVPTGRAIQAAAPGRVTYAGWMGGYGNTVIIDHGSIDTLYAHQSSIAARSGQSVARGRTIGYVGSTGNSTGPHLHFEVRVGGSPKDPLSYLP